jgi:hypothetical protein
MRTFPDFSPRIIRFLRQGMSVYVDRKAGNTGHGEASRVCRNPGIAEFNYSVLGARGQAIFSMCFRCIGIRSEL